MAVAQQYVSRQSSGRGGPSGLADVLDVLLDKGLVIDAFVRVSLVGIELLTIDARIVVAGVDTYLHFAEAVNRLDLLQQRDSETVPELLGVGGRSSGRGSGEKQTDSGRSSGGGNRELENSDAYPSGKNESGGSGDQQSDDERGSDDRSGSKGLLSRLVDRGQAF